MTFGRVPQHEVVRFSWPSHPDSPSVERRWHNQSPWWYVFGWSILVKVENHISLTVSPKYIVPEEKKIRNGQCSQAIRVTFRGSMSSFGQPVLALKTSSWLWFAVIGLHFVESPSHLSQDRNKPTRETHALPCLSHVRLNRTTQAWPLGQGSNRGSISNAYKCCSLQRNVKYFNLDVNNCC